MSEKSNKGRQRIILVLLGGVVGILLLIFGGSFDGSDEKDVDTAEQTDIYTMAEEYADMLEARVADICSGVGGVSDVKVFVSLSGGYRTVYAYDSQSTASGYKSELVMSGSGADKKAVIAAYEYPEISGVGIVCRGGDDPETRRQIISLVAASLNISTNKIFVAGT